MFNMKPDVMLEPKISRVPVHNPDGSVEKWLTFQGWDDSGRPFFKGENGDLYYLETMAEIKQCGAERLKN